MLACSRLFVGSSDFLLLGLGSFAFRASVVANIDVHRFLDALTRVTVEVPALLDNKVAHNQI